MALLMECETDFGSPAINMALLMECDTHFCSPAINMALLMECETHFGSLAINMALLMECETFSLFGSYKHRTPLWSAAWFALRRSEMFIATTRSQARTPSGVPC